MQLVYGISFALSAIYGFALTQKYEVAALSGILGVVFLMFRVLSDIANPTLVEKIVAAVVLVLFPVSIGLAYLDYLIAGTVAWSIGTGLCGYATVTLVQKIFSK